MVSTKKGDLVTLLKCLDFDYMSQEDEEFSCELDINDLNDQDKIIEKLIVSSYNSLDERSKKIVTESLRMNIEDSGDIDYLFDQLSLPFSSEFHHDKRKDFLIKISGRIE